MGEHTKGPWVWYENPSGGCRVQTTGVGIADVLSRAGVPHPVQESCAANARLIAAAPELLEELERVLAGMSGFVADHEYCPFCGASYCGFSEGDDCLRHSDDCPLTAARAAIAKARET